MVYIWFLFVAPVQPVQSNAPSSGSGLMDLLGGGTPPTTDTGMLYCTSLSVCLD